MKNMDWASKYIQIVMFMSDNFKKIKNMALVYSIGLIYQINLSNIIKVSGGVDYLLDKVHIKDIMVILL
jgi:hypothetical protein